MQNLKVDIIYHLTASDFEMEFNLCGCCRMRLLSDKTNDKKSFVKALARDVARSRVIMACGPLFGNDSIITTVATAIGSGTSLCDNSTYGIKGRDEIHIINGSTPLVTADGYFGGCIIESGPQTIILLTENKTFRKSIMQNLIHPYIEEISYIPPRQNPITAPAEEPVLETAAKEDEIYLTQPDEEYEKDVEPEIPENLPEVLDEHNIEFIMDGGDDSDEDGDEPSTPLAPIDENYNLLYTEIEKPSDIKERYNDPYVPSESDNLFIAEREIDDTETKNSKLRNARSMNVTIVVLVLLLLLALLALLYLLVLNPMTMGISTTDYVKEIFGLVSSMTSV